MRLITVLLLLIIGLGAVAQNKKINNTTQLWSEADLAGKLKTKLKWQLDLQYIRQSPYERLNLFCYNSQLSVRPWLHYYPVKNVRISMFVGVWYHFYIAEITRKYPEYRTAIQVNYYRNRKASILTNRFRTELRNIEDRQNKFEQVFRYRYMLKYMHTLIHRSFDKRCLYAIGLDEFFVNGGSKVTGYHSFDQNRLFLGLGYNFTNDLTVETGYFNQYLQRGHNDNLDMNHIWQLSLIVDNITFNRHLHVKQKPVEKAIEY